MTQRKKRSRSNETVGLWIQCCEENCKKWRFVKEYNDPLSVPEKWFCSENFDENFASCDIPEEKTENNLVESKYVPGNIVWAKLTGYPWWPAIIDNCPVKNTFYELGNTSDIPLRYHVTFIEEGEVHRSWMKSAKIKPFNKDDGNQPKRAKHSDSESLQKSLEIAKSALSLDNDKRLKMCSFSLRHDELNDIPKRRKLNVKYINSNSKQNEIKIDSPQNRKIINSNLNFETTSTIVSLINLPRQFCVIQ